jgi:tetratricopeptide (TPR) repeat protein
MLAASPGYTQSCGDWRAELVAVEGTVEINRSGTQSWVAALRGEHLCVGDLIRVQAYSRAALRLPDDTVLRLDQNTTTRWAQPQNQDRSLLDVIRGVIHVISRDPRALSFQTPFANAGLEGTEFVIEVSDDRTDVTVLEGGVVMTNESGSTEIDAGQRGTAQPDTATTVAPASNVQDAIRWTLYFAPVLAGQLPRPDQTPTLAQRNDPDFFAARAAARLLVGGLEAAHTDLDRTLSLDPTHVDARALQADIAVTLNDSQEAIDLAEQALAVDPDSAAARLALARARTAQFDLPAARAALEAAVAEHPDNAIAWANLAEAHLATGDLAGGLDAANRAVTLNPGLAHAHTVLGFAELMNLNLIEARQSFETAIDLDAAAPLPRLGSGLALIRAGDLDAGRREIELAVLLTPNNALARSYVANAYYDERRDELPTTQLALAKNLDPTEPTPWLYDALQKQATNRPVEAMQDLERAATLNDQQAVYRSRLRLDEDLAVRSAALGRTYRDLGFERLALVDGWRSVQRDPADFSGHRLLADTYSTLPRHQIARVNELFQSQLLQPLNVTAIPPQLGESNLFILDSAGPADLAYNEFNPLLAGNGWTVQGAGIAAGNDTRGEHATVSGIHDRVSYSLGHFGYETAGFRENNDLDTEVRNAFVQYRPNAKTSLLAELRSTDTRKGDLQLLFDPENYDPLLRQADSADSVRIGARRVLSERADLLFSVQEQQNKGSTSAGADFNIRGRFDSSAYEVQHYYRRSRWRLSSGLSSSRTDFEETVNLSIPLPVPPFETELSESTTTRAEMRSAYVYGHYAVSDNLTATLGASFDAFDGQSVTDDQLNPKLGLIWTPQPGTTVRLAAFRTLQGPYASKDSLLPKIEPTQVAGFNQFFFGDEGDDVTRLGIGVDRVVTESLFVGAEISNRSIDREIVVSGPGPLPGVTQVRIDESLASGYGYWTPTTSLALGAELQLEEFDNNGDVLAEGFAELRTARVPLRLKYFHPSGISAGITVTYVDQTGDFGTLFAGPGGLENVIARDGDTFWVADASLGYRLPNRHGIIGLYVQNLFDEVFRFQDTDPENPRIMPERLVSLRFTLAF